MVIFRLTHNGNSNFACWLLDGQTGEKVELLVNTIGPFDGSKGVGVPQGSYLLDIEADGNWSIRIEQPRPTNAPSPPLTLTGATQAAAGPVKFSKGLATFQMKHSGEENFAIWLLDFEGDKIELLVNEIGPFEGSKAVSIPKSGIYWFDVTASGNWSIAITQ